MRRALGGDRVLRPTMPLVGMIRFQKKIRFLMPTVGLKALAVVQDGIFQERAQAAEFHAFDYAGVKIDTA